MSDHKDTHNFIYIKGAKENNLKDIDIVIPKNKLVVFTGVSGSGKSSLAFATIYEEGKRRYIDSLSSYARQFLGGTKKPNVESIHGLSPAVSIEQKTTQNNPRSTVGTITEIYDYLRLLFSKIGKPFCPNHKKEISVQKMNHILENIFSLPEDNLVMFLAPVISNKKGSHENLLQKIEREGFLRLRIDNEIYKLGSDDIKLDKNKKHNIDIVVDRFAINEPNRQRIIDSINVAFEYGNGIAIVHDYNKNQDIRFSKLQACDQCDFNMPNIENRLFSFNSPYGMCSVCKGLGTNLEADFDLVAPEKFLSIEQGGIKYFGKSVNTKSMEWQEFEVLLNYYNIDKQIPITDLTGRQLKIIKYGSDVEIAYNIISESGKEYKYDRRIEGILNKIERKYLETSSEDLRSWFKRFMSEFPCNHCHGSRLNNYALSVLINGLNIFEVGNLAISEAIEFFANLKLNEFENQVSKSILDEIKVRLSFLNNVGLEYLSLNRTAATLSGGESQRIRLASQIGSKLTGILYVLDEPSIGLHQKDNQKLIDSLKQMVEIGNTLIVVEHDEETILAADYIFDIGPLAGQQGGYLVAQGTINDIKNNPDSLTGQFLSGKREIEIPKIRRAGKKQFIIIEGASENNLKNIDVEIPLGKLVVITGVSGSGKSSLINEILVKGITKEIHGSQSRVGAHKAIKGIYNLDKLVAISQAPIGRTPRSNPATYTSVFDDIRDVFASTEQARTMGFNKGKFSFNLPYGRCDKCQGDGQIKIEMYFMPDIYVLCDHCGGKRYLPDVLEVKYKGKSIADVLEMSVEEAYNFFATRAKIKDKLQALMDVGLNYISLGQSATTLSGGEAQRIKLATYLQKKATGKSMFVLDEPTTGLHSYDVANLIQVLNRIVDNGDTVVVIEHNLDVIKVADYIIDLGPNGGSGGGQIVAKGTPEAVAKNPNSYTGLYLSMILNTKD
ncbi:excinuclease ABC subunit UvrA [Mesomycoplasma conjunctivae]|uniref:excinuclease ABC subunit UvrA n=1 Tax=Mesomycoplasma conjunctivae TaxID=45361 RepID=UPI003DA4EC14